MAKGRGGLGRGLESLFEDAAPSFESDTRIETLPLREIEPDPGQPRKTFDDETLAELSASIAEHGLLQPIAVRPRASGGYLIVAGERRWRASRMAGLTEVPVIVKDVTDEQAMELALVENLQREDLDPVEEAAGIRELMDRCGLTQEQAARKLGKSRSALANILRLLTLPDSVLELLKSGFITIGHAKVVLGLPTPELQAEAAQMIADNQLNVRQAEALCKNAGQARERACGPAAAQRPAGGSGRKPQAGTWQRSPCGLPRRQGQAHRPFLFRRPAEGVRQSAGAVQRGVNLSEPSAKRTNFTKCQGLSSVGKAARRSCAGEVGRSNCSR